VARKLALLEAGVEEAGSSFFGSTAGGGALNPPPFAAPNVLGDSFAAGGFTVMLLVETAGFSLLLAAGVLVLVEEPKTDLFAEKPPGLKPLPARPGGGPDEAVVCCWCASFPAAACPLAVEASRSRMPLQVASCSVW
jgi:hypothetical protein